VIPDGPKGVLGHMSVIHATDDPSQLSTRLIFTQLAPRFPPGDPDHDPTPLYQISVVLEENQ
jgi:hypothetical protein